MRPIRTFVSEYVHPSHSVSTHPVGSTIIAIGWDEHIRIDDVRSGPVVKSPNMRGPTRQEGKSPPEVTAVPRTFSVTSTRPVP